MSTLKQDWVLNGSTTASSTPTPATKTATEKPVDVRDCSAISLFMKATGGTSMVFTVQVTADPEGLLGWQNAAYREGGGGAYGTTAITLVPATARSVYLDPTDNICWVRLAVTANTGPTTVTARVFGER